MEKSEKKRIDWYNDPSIITNSLIGLIIINILLSQSFAIKNELSALNILSSILSHNSVYLILVIYFILLKTKIGKKYFDFLNICLIFIYLFTSFTSLLSVLQTFNLGSIMSLCINLFFVLYLVHTFLRGTRLWKEFKLSKSPFNEFTNDGFYYIIVILSVILLAVNLIMTTSFDGTILALLDCSVIVLFGRYIYSYRKYLDDKKIDSKNDGNFDKVVDAASDEIKEVASEVKEFVKETSDNISDKFNEVVDVEKISKAVNKTNEKIVDLGHDVKEKVEELKDKTEIDEAIESVKDKVVEFGKDISDKVEDFIDEKKKDDKVVDEDKASKNKKKKTTIKEGEK